MYFQLIYDVLREPMRRALEKVIMEWQIQENPTFPPFIQKLIEGGKLEGMREGTREGKLEAKRDDLLRLMARLGLEPTAEQRARILSCTDVATLDRWFDNAFGGKTAADVLT